MIKTWFNNSVYIQKPTRKEIGKDAQVVIGGGGGVSTAVVLIGEKRDFNFIHPNTTLSNLAVGKLNSVLPAVQQRSLKVISLHLVEPTVLISFTIHRSCFLQVKTPHNKTA